MRTHAHLPCFPGAFTELFPFRQASPSYPRRQTFNYPQGGAGKLRSPTEMSVQFKTLLMQSLGWEPRKTSAGEGLGSKTMAFQKLERKHGLIGNVQSVTLRMCACRRDWRCSSNRCLEGSGRAFRLSARIGRTRRRHIDSYPISV